MISTLLMYHIHRRYWEFDPNYDFVRDPSDARGGAVFLVMFLAVLVYRWYD